jgi:hypothetical protein
MIIDVYKHLVENEEQILKDLSMLKYIRTDLDSVVQQYIENVIREYIPSADAETLLMLKEEPLIQNYINGAIDALRSTHGNKDSLH